MTFTFLDIVFFIVVLFFSISAAINGFIKEIFSKLAVVAGIIAAVSFGPVLAPSFESIIKNSTVDLILSFILLFIVAFLAVKILQIIFSGIFSGEVLGSLNRILGFIFGLLEGFVVVCCLVIILEAQPWFHVQAGLEKSSVVNIVLPYLETPITKISGMFV